MIFGTLIRFDVAQLISNYFWNIRPKDNMRTGGLLSFRIA